MLEVDLALARQRAREALGGSESEEAGAALEQLQQLGERLEHSWAGVRWIRDVLSEARAKRTSLGITVAALAEW